MRQAKEKAPSAAAGDTALPRWFLPGVLALALAVRCILLGWPRAYHPDEIYQYLEQAHRLVFGYGAIPWEYRLGIRNWLFPVLLSGPMRLGAWVAPASDAYVLLPKLSLVLVSLLSVRAAWCLGRRISVRHGQVAALVAALWPGFVVFSGQALTDAVAVPFILAAAASLEEREPGGRTRRLALGGAMLTLAALLRVQYAPAELVLLAVTLWRQRTLRAIGWIACGAAAVLLAYAAFEWAAGRVPFAWIDASWHQNLTVGRSERYGVRSAPWYLGSLFGAWSVWSLPIVVLAVIGAFRYPALMAMAVANIAVHSAIAHKEYRFILLSTMTLVILAAIGSASWALRRPGRWRVGILAAFWMTGAAASLASHAEAKLWAKTTPGIEAYRYLRRQPALCGLAQYQAWWSHGGGYTYLHRPVPIYLPDLAPDTEAQLSQHQTAFNYILSPPAPTHPLPGGYRREACFGTGGRFPERALCVYHRPGGCLDAGPGAKVLTLNSALADADK